MYNVNQYVNCCKNKVVSKMNEVSLNMVDWINLYLPKEYELKLSHSDITSEWKAENRNFKLVQNSHGHCALINEKRMVDFNPEFLAGAKEVSKWIMVSMLCDIGINVSNLNRATIASLDGEFIYIVKSRKSYGGLIACDYTHNKELIIDDSWVLNYGLGTTYKNRVNDVWIKG